jgi:hypothetical protein
MNKRRLVLEAVQVQVERQLVGRDAAAVAPASGSAVAVDGVRASAS